MPGPPSDPPRPAFAGAASSFVCDIVAIRERARRTIEAGGSREGR